MWISQFHLVCHDVLDIAPRCHYAHADKFSLWSDHIWPHNTTTYHPHCSTLLMMISTPIASLTCLSRYNFAQRFILHFRIMSQIFNVMRAIFIALLHNLHANTNSAHIHLELTSITEFAGHTLAMSSLSSLLCFIKPELACRHWGNISYDPSLSLGAQLHPSLLSGDRTSHLNMVRTFVST